MRWNILITLLVCLVMVALRPGQAIDYTSEKSFSTSTTIVASPPLQVYNELPEPQKIDFWSWGERYQGEVALQLLYVLNVGSQDVTVTYMCDLDPGVGVQMCEPSTFFLEVGGRQDIVLTLTISEDAPLGKVDWMTTYAASD